MLKVIFIDDEPLIRQGLKSIIDWSQYGYVVCGEACNGIEAMEKIMELSPDVAIVDINLPGCNGLAMLQAIRKKGYNCKIIILSGYSEFKYAQQAVELGVEAYLLKPIEQDELIEKVVKIRDNIYASSRLKFHNLNTIQKKLLNQKFIYGSDNINTNIAEPYQNLEKLDTASAADSLQTLIDKLYIAIDVNNMITINTLLEDYRLLLIDLQLSEQDIKACYIKLYTELISKIVLGNTEISSIIKIDNNVISGINKSTSLQYLNGYTKYTLVSISDELFQTRPDSMMKKILDYIYRNYQSDIKISTLAEVFRYNSSYLGKMFRKYTGKSFNSYLEEIRIEKAKYYLEKGHKISNVAEMVGYKDINYFYCKFKQNTGCSPTTYKQSSKLPGEEVTASES